MKDNIPCIITVAITGSVPKKIDNPTIPITVSEQIESTRKCHDAGASLVHPVRGGLLLVIICPLWMSYKVYKLQPNC